MQKGAANVISGRMIAALATAPGALRESQHSSDSVKNEPPLPE
jgi:hypothetical protein